MSAPVLVREAGKAGTARGVAPALGDRLSTSAAVCAQHGKDESYHQPHAPDAVAFAQSTEEVAEIVRSVRGTRRRSSRSAPARRSKAMSRR
jgi:FAD/FMN-containing dehydrogenase